MVDRLDTEPSMTAMQLIEYDLVFLKLYYCSIVARAGLKASDIVLEIGPGTGNLTVRLLEQSKKVIAVEFDRRMVREVLKRVEGR